ncbi:GAF and ANTAR domain-containing protein [Streptomyces daliensis]|uniref:GAF and ANTAR domain-containing protein n=1 Tax=Streptomyces daliensis TaxID=299421 RepID=A0A8T4IHS1_9ACTN|nr:GAF and ANTAR domain-containing protein [Streptomyces daliensis]
MISAAMAEALAVLAAPAANPPRLSLTAFTRALRLDGLAVSLRDDVGRPQTVAYDTERAALLEDAQFTLGVGPSEEAMKGGVRVMVEDIGGVDPARWPGLPSLADSLTVRSVFAFPLRVGAVNVGVLTGHRTRPGPLGHQPTDDALALAGALVLPLVDWAIRIDEHRIGPVDEESLLHHAELHQATGVVTAQLGIPPEQALLRLRAHAFRHGLPLREVAGQVVARRLVLSGHGDDLGSTGGGSRRNRCDPDAPQ